MVIGDSVDRYMVSDWCLENGGILYTDKTMNAFSALNQLMSPLSRRFKSWEFRTCISLSRGINISYVFNRIGVRTQGPFYMPLTTVAGLNEKEKSLLRNSNSQEKSIAITIGPALKALTNPGVLGGEVDAVFLHSGFWDLSKRVDIIGQDNGAVAKDNWIDSWFNNATILMSLIQKQYPKANFFGWRYLSDFTIVHSASKNSNVNATSRNWHDATAHKLKDKMNHKLQLLQQNSSSRTSKKLYQILDHRLLHSRLARRDLLHVSKAACVQIFESFLSKIDKA